LKREQNPELFKHRWIYAFGSFLLGPQRSIFLYHHPPIDELQVAVSFWCPEGEIPRKCGNDPARLTAHSMNALKDFAPFGQQILQSLTPESFQNIIEFKDRNPAKFDKTTGRLFNSKSGRVTLIGDAAHLMIPFQAAGGNNALLDAQKLSDELAKLIQKPHVTTDDIEKALSNYEREMSDRTASAVVGSRKAAKDLHTSSYFQIVTRNTFMRIMNWKMNVWDQKPLIRWSSWLVAASLFTLGAAFLTKKYLR